MNLHVHLNLCIQGLNKILNLKIFKVYLGMPRDCWRHHLVRMLQNPFYHHDLIFI